MGGCDEQAIDAFEYVDTVTGDSPEPPGDFVLVLDDLGTPATGTSGAIAAGLALVDALGPHDRLAVVNTGPFPLIQQLSTDRAASRAMIRQFLGQRDSSASRSEACRRSVVSLGVIENALKVMAQQVSTRRSMLVVSDGERAYWGQAKQEKCSEARKVFDRVVVSAAVAKLPVYGTDPRAPQPSAMQAAPTTPRPEAVASPKVRRPSDMPRGGLGGLAQITGGTLTGPAAGPADAAHQLVRDTRQFYRLVYRQPVLTRSLRNQLRSVEVRVQRIGVSSRARSTWICSPHVPRYDWAAPCAKGPNCATRGTACLFFKELRPLETARDDPEPPRIVGNLSIDLSH